MLFREGVVPPGGFWYEQAFPSGPITLRGETIYALADVVMDFRSRFGLDIGDPLKEVEASICARWPHLCNAFDTSAPQVADESPQGNDVRRITAWRSNRYSEHSRGGSEAARQDIAEARAKICSECPAHKEKPTEGCLPCIQENERVLFVLRQGKETSVKPGICPITGQDNETASFMTGDGLNYSKKYHEELRKANPSCWLLPESPLR